MKKNKFRNNNYNNQGYSLNYKFDSVSPAGKCCGTALDLIKRYNDLAKEAHGNGDYVEAEVFRQYAEHYRKIVTEINERKQRFEPKDVQAVTNTEVSATSTPLPDEATSTSEVSDDSPKHEGTLVETKPKKAFTVIEITEEDAVSAKPRRQYKPRQKKSSDENAVNA